MFSLYGQLGDFYRPVTLCTERKPSRFAFARYIEKSCADDAVNYLHGYDLHGVKLTVAPAKQESFFTRDTGFITNSALDTPIIENNYFDDSMPPEHQRLKREEYLKQVDVVYTVRVDDLDENVE